MHVQVIGVPFNSSGRGNGVALAPGALRRAGLLRRLAAAGLEVSDAADVEVGAMTPRRSPAPAWWPRRRWSPPSTTPASP